MDSSNGRYQAISLASKKKYKKNITDNRTSIVAYKTGTIGENTGPTMLLLAYRGEEIKRTMFLYS